MLSVPLTGVAEGTAGVAVTAVGEVFGVGAGAGFAVFGGDLRDGGGGGGGF